ncbi:MAG: nicotinamide mononucleotide transporter [Ruminococcaceae bacterium]|nr:nicotinamide mononucleotide transporter [Oscillospiraceae bacterium]
MKRIISYYNELSYFEKGLWIVSVIAVVLSSAFSGFGDPLSTIASLIGVTALIFVAKGYVIGQVLTIVFALFYGFISFFFRYYGEMITYIGMSAPMAAVAAIEWLKNPYKDTKEVKIKKMTVGTLILLFSSCALVTFVFYFILKAIGNASPLVSTISVTTSYLASALTFLRSPYYALAYAANDLVLIVLWVIASLSDFSCIPMTVCFVMFFANDMYGFFNWKRMAKKQSS